MANATPGSNTINLTVAGTYRITTPGAGEDNNATGDFDILPNAASPAGSTLTIQNISGGKAVVDGNHLHRVFDINPGNVTAPAKFTVLLQGFTVQNGDARGDGAAGSGGGIRDRGNVSLTLTDMTVANNRATADGGGIVVENVVSTPWTLTVNTSTISNNHAGDAGGGIDTDGSGKTLINPGTVITGNTAVNQGAGIWLDAVQAGDTFQTSALTVNGAFISNNKALSAEGLGGGIGNDGTLALTTSTVSDNSATSDGGGIYNANTLTLTDCTISGNSAIGIAGIGGFGGGIDNFGTLTLTNCTLSGNSAGYGGGGLLQAGTARLVNTIVAANFRGSSTTADDIQGIDVDTANSFNNLIGTGGSGGLTDGSNGNQVGVADARLGPPAFNGGPTQTHALLPGSPALDAGDNSRVPAGVTTDQRGFNRFVGSATDIGAFEVRNQAPTAIALSNSSVAENQPAGTLVGTFSTTDPDSGDTFAYTLVSGTGDADNASFTLDAGGDLKTAAPFDFEARSSYSVRVRSTDAGGLSVEKVFAINVTNVNEAPAITSFTVPASGTEGSALALSAVATDPDGAADPLTFTWTITRPDSSTVTLTGASVSFTPADNGSYGVSLTVSAGASATRSASIAVANLALTAALTGPAAGVRYQPRGFTLSATDPSGADTAAGFVYTITWGDGAPVQTIARSPGNGSGVGVDHVFAAAGTYTVTVTATDGGTSVVAGRTVTIVPAALLPDPLRPGQLALFVGGTAAADEITVERDGSTCYQVGIETGGSEWEGTFTGSVSRIVVYGGAGNDAVAVADDIQVPAWLYGGDGDDKPQGGGGNNVLLGGAGNDELHGGAGRDLLIGGLGADYLYGDGGDDLLIAGTTAFDGNEAALDAVLAEWTSARSYADRVANLRGSGSGPLANGGTFLKVSGPDVTVFDDGAADVLSGASGTDWFFAHRSGGVLDQVPGLGSGEFVEELGVLRP
jgi:hypothetical protein